MTCEAAQMDVAAALLTGRDLDPAVAEHVAHCPSCSAEQASLRGVRTVMASVSADDVGAPRQESADDLLRARILQAVAQQQSRDRVGRRVRAAIIATAAAIFLGMAGIAVGRAIFTPPTMINASSSTGDLSATASMTADGNYTALDVSVTGLPYDTDCVVVVHTATGQAIPIAAWRAEYEGTARVNGVAAARPEAITHVTLTQPDGTVLLDIPVES